MLNPRAALTSTRTCCRTDSTALWTEDCATAQCKCANAVRLRTSQYTVRPDQQVVPVYLVGTAVRRRAAPAQSGVPIPSLQFSLVWPTVHSAIGERHSAHSLAPTHAAQRCGPKCEDKALVVLTQSSVATHSRVGLAFATLYLEHRDHVALPHRELGLARRVVRKQCACLQPSGPIVPRYTTSIR